MICPCDFDECFDPFPNAICPSGMTDWTVSARFRNFVSAPPLEPESTIPTRCIEPDNQLTRTRLSGRDNRDFGPKRGETGWRGSPSCVSRDTDGEPETRRETSQPVAGTGVETKKADVVSVGFVS